MTRFKLGLGAILLGWIAILGVAFHFLFQTTPPLSPDHNVALYDASEDFSVGSLGVERRAELLADTKLYLSEHKDDAAPAVVQGKELAPADFLNRKLADHGMKWRVSKVSGMNAEIYEVS